MWKRKVSIKEQYGSLKHFLKGDEDCHYIGQRYIEGTNIFARREWRGVKDTSYAFYRWLVTWGKMAGLVARDPVRIMRAFSATAGSAPISSPRPWWTAGSRGTGAWPCAAT